jgi:Acetamidase/Formamidase family
MQHALPATPSTVHWGYFDPRLEPALVVASGDLVAIETLTNHAGDAPDLMMDPQIADVFASVTDRGPGPHLLTGPIAVDGARPGDVLQVDILTATPRLPYGSNLAAHWGHLYDVLPTERVTIYELDVDALLGRALFGYDWTATAPGNRAGDDRRTRPRRARTGIGGGGHPAATALRHDGRRTPRTAAGVVGASR